MNKPHKHAALIKQWADGAVIQVKSHSTGNWLDIREDASVLWIPHNEYRVKPVQAKCRIALMSGNVLHISRDAVNASCIGRDPHFIRWLTDWIEYEV